MDTQKQETGGLTCLGRVVVFVFILASLGGAYWFLFMQGNAKGTGTGTGTSTTTVTPTTNTNVSPTPLPAGAPIELGIAYGTEKKLWLTWAVQQFQSRPEAQRIKINLIPMGSLEGAQALLAADQRIQVWSPASAIYEDTFVQEWQIKHAGNPILKKELLALSPMVFVSWQERYEAFVQKYKTVTFATIGQALQEKGGWDAIAQKPEWGLFKFGHTHPNKSNSGLVTLFLMSAEFLNKPAGLEMKDVLNPELQTWMQNVERATNTSSDSTGNLMKEMVLKGPSSFDFLYVYESVAIDYLKSAAGRWGELRVTYPARNMWNDNPYYIVDAPWSTKEHRQAAQIFLDFLLSDPVQTQALVHGFRPGNPAISIKGPDSPFNVYEKAGLKVDLTTIVPAPKADVINNLLQSWQRAQSGR